MYIRTPVLKTSRRLLLWNIARYTFLNKAVLKTIYFLSFSNKSIGQRLGTKRKFFLTFCIKYYCLNRCNNKKLKTNHLYFTANNSLGKTYKSFLVFGPLRVKSSDPQRKKNKTFFYDLKKLTEPHEKKIKNSLLYSMLVNIDQPKWIIFANICKY